MRLNGNLSASQPAILVTIKRKWNHCCLVNTGHHLEGNTEKRSGQGSLDSLPACKINFSESLANNHC